MIENARRRRKSRLKGGCRQDCLPHKTGMISAALHRVYLKLTVLDDVLIVSFKEL